MGRPGSDRRAGRHKLLPRLRSQPPGARFAGLAWLSGNRELVLTGGGPLVAVIVHREPAPRWCVVAAGQWSLDDEPIGADPGIAGEVLRKDVRGDDGQEGRAAQGGEGLPG